MVRVCAFCLLGCFSVVFAGNLQTNDYTVQHDFDYDITQNHNDDTQDDGAPSPEELSVDDTEYMFESNGLVNEDEATPEYSPLSYE